MAHAAGSVLVAVDFGDASARAVSIGGAIARGFEEPLHLLHAETIEAPPYFTHDQIEALERQRQATRAQAGEFLKRFGQAHTAYPFTAVVDDRRPVDAILHHAWAATLVVMGTHGRQGPRRWWLGSVAERVLRASTRPLLVTRAETPADPALVFARVTVRVQDTPADETATSYADALARRVGGTRTANEPTLIVVAVPTPITGAWLTHSGEPLVRSCSLPVLFVPALVEGGPS